MTTAVLTPDQVRRRASNAPDWLDAVCREAERTGRLVECTWAHAPTGTYLIAAATVLDPDDTCAFDVRLLSDGTYRFHNVHPLHPKKGA